MRPLVEYTNEEIDALTEGPSIDVLIASHVMGYKICIPSSINTAIRGGCRVSFGIYIDTGERHEWGPVVCDLPRYSTDIGAAWVVVCAFDFWDMAKTVSGYYRVNLRKRMNGSTAGYVHGLGEYSSAPLAICKAALKAVRAQRLREVAHA